MAPQKVEVKKNTEKKDLKIAVNDSDVITPKANPCDLKSMSISCCISARELNKHSFFDDEKPEPLKV